MPIDRRTVTKLLTLLPVSACAGHGPAATTPLARGTTTEFDAGAVEDYRPYSAKRFRKHRVIVIRDERGVMAVSAVCTHEGCIVALRSTSLFCQCHSSTFTMTGEVVGGPATKPLPHYMVTLVDGRIRIAPSQEVSPAYRLTV